MKIITDNSSMDYGEIIESLQNQFEFDMGFLAPGREDAYKNIAPDNDIQFRDIAWKAWLKGRNRGMSQAV